MTDSVAPYAAIVEDDSSVLLAHSSLLRSLGWRVRLYSSAENFLESAQLDDVACVISDVQMPGMNGLAMQRRLQEDGYALPFIFVTAFASDATGEQALKQGALCVLGKPADDEEIARHLERIWKGSG